MGFGVWGLGFGVSFLILVLGFCVEGSCGTCCQSVRAEGRMSEEDNTSMTTAANNYSQTTNHKPQPTNHNPQPTTHNTQHTNPKTQCQIYTERKTQSCDRLACSRFMKKLQKQVNKRSSRTFRRKLQILHFTSSNPKPQTPNPEPCTLNLKNVMEHYDIRRVKRCKGSRHVGVDYCDG